MGDVLKEKYFLPEWLEAHVTTGRDPLGMQAGSIMLYQSLLPGISNITLRSRYYSFFSFLVHEYANRFHDTSQDNWIRYLRRAEALYALVAANQDQYQTGIAGIEWAGKTLESSHGESIDFIIGADHSTTGAARYLKNKGGVFSAAYAGSMSEIGIISYSDAHPIPIASEEMGEPLAEAFKFAIGDMTELFVEKIVSGVVTREEMDVLSVMLPDQIIDGSTEQELLCSILFADSMKNLGRQVERRKTLQLMLHVAEAIQSSPKQNDFRWLNYAGQTQNGMAFDVPDFLHETREFWWVYQANDLLHIIYERFFSLILHMLAEEPNGVQLSVAASTAAKLIAEDLGEYSWMEYVDSVAPASNANNPQDDGSEYALAQVICRKPKDVEAQVICSAHAVRLLAVLMQRISDHSDALAQTYGEGAKFGRAELQTLCSEQVFLGEHENSSLDEMLLDLFMKRVIYRHQAIALHKLKGQGDYTFLFEIEENRATRRMPFEPVFTNPRVNNALAFITDLHLINDDGVTDAGRSWMTQ